MCIREWFRRERPQRGRYRQFHQIGAEALGFGGPEVDAELILLAAHLWAELGIRHWRLEGHCPGQPCLFYNTDGAGHASSVDPGVPRIIKTKQQHNSMVPTDDQKNNKQNS